MSRILPPGLSFNLASESSSRLLWRDFSSRIHLYGAEIHRLEVSGRPRDQHGGGSSHRRLGLQLRAAVLGGALRRPGRRVERPPGAVHPERTAHEAPGGGQHASDDGQHRLGRLREPGGLRRRRIMFLVHSRYSSYIHSYMS